MRDHRPSDTAEGVCLFRAWERGLAEQRRIVDDPYARHFLSRRGRVALRAMRALGPGTVLADRMLSGLAGYALSRHACFDDWLIAALASGQVEQVVLLGAGYDSRAWRLAEQLGERTLYEVDHPATGTRKSQLVRQRAGAWPAAPRRSVPVDLSVETFRPCLEGAGWRPEQPTFWIWEGVSMYLSPEDVAATLQAVRDASAEGSRLAVDFWSMPVGWRPRAALTRLAAETFALLGEPVRGSFDIARGRSLFDQLGLEVADLADSEALRQRHVPDGRPVLPDCWCALLVTG